MTGNGTLLILSRIYGGPACGVGSIVVIKIVGEVMRKRSGCSLFLRRFAVPVALVAAWLTAVPADAQRRETSKRVQVRLLDLSGRSVPEPEFRANVSNRFDARGVSSPDEKRAWFILHAVYESAPEWTDDVNVTFFALFKPSRSRDVASDPGSKYLMLAGDNTYINVKQGNHNAYMFIHPDTLDRYGDVEQIAVLLKHRGQEVGSLGEPEAREPWWTKLQPVSGQLLARGDTPFGMVNRGYYDMVKPGASARR